MRTSEHWNSVLFAAALITQLPSVRSQIACSVCADPTESVSLPDVAVSLPPFGEVSCEFLQNTLHLLLTIDDERCGLIQSVSTLCGCSPPTSVSDPCSLCPFPSVVGDEWFDVPVKLRGQDATCGLAEISLSTVEESSTECEEGALLANSCGCLGGSELPNDPPPIPGNDFEPCSTCWDGSEVSRPEKIINNMAENVGFALPDGVNATCSSIGGFLQALPAQSNDCAAARIVLGGVCGCPRVPNSCELCPNDEIIPLPDKLYVPSGLWIRNLPTCQESADVLHQIPAGDEGAKILREPLGLSPSVDFCLIATSTSYVCGCDSGQRQYFGANSETRRGALAWIPRVSGMLSLCGSLLILRDIHRNRKGNGLQVYHTLVAGLSTSDIVSSLVWIASTAPLPKTFEYSYGTFESKVYGALGSQNSCAAQGFFMELGIIGSVSYNLVLCVYYMLVIVYGKREENLKKKLWCFHIFPVVLALGFSAGGIPIYEFAVPVCLVAAPPATDSWTYALIFIICPLAIATGAVTIIMLVIYCHVRKTSRAARRWDFSRRSDGTTHNSSTSGNPGESGGRPEPQRCWRRFAKYTTRKPPGTNAPAGGAGTRMEQAVFWQCVFFLVVFYITWPFFYASQFLSTSTDYGFWVAVAIFTPLQGFFNALVYARPRISRCLQKRQEEYKRKRQHGNKPEEVSSTNKSIPTQTDSKASGHRSSADNCVLLDDTQPEDESGVVPTVHNTFSLPLSSGTSRQEEAMPDLLQQTRSLENGGSDSNMHSSGMDLLPQQKSNVENEGEDLNDEADSKNDPLPLQNESVETAEEDGTIERRFEREEEDAFQKDDSLKRPDVFSDVADV